MAQITYCSPSRSIVNAGVGGTTCAGLGDTTGRCVGRK